MKLIDRTAELVDLGQCDVLCVGCRNVAELDYFRRKGVRNVIGIDLFSESQDILVMDMHHMSFPDNYFDVIYSSHSLEHAYDVRQAINEMVRVAHSGTLIVVEVPVRYDTKYIGTDLVDFGSLDNLHQYFNPYLEQVLWSETIQVGAFDCELGTDAIATVFRLIKPRSTYRVDATAIIESRIAEDKTCT